MKKRHSAFTMIELLLVVAIMAIVAYVTIPSYLTSQSKQKLTNNAKEILRLMNEGRNRAIAGLAIEGEDTNDDNYVDVEETILPHAFGVYFSEEEDFTDANSSTSRAVLFADEDGDWLFDEDIDSVIEELEFPYVARIYDLEVMEETNLGEIKYEPTEAIVFYRVPLGDVILRFNDGTWYEEEDMPDLNWLRVDTGMWQMSDEEGEINDSVYVRSVVAHSVSDYAYMCSTIAEYNDDSTACSRTDE